MKSILLLFLSVTAQAASFNPTNCPARNRLLYSSTNVTTSAWVTLIASSSIDVSYLEVFDSSGQTMQIGIGPVGSEVVQRIIFPGGNDGFIPIVLKSGQRLAIEALSGTASSGESDINLCQ